MRATPATATGRRLWASVAALAAGASLLAAAGFATGRSEPVDKGWTLRAAWVGAGAVGGVDPADSLLGVLTGRALYGYALGRGRHRLIPDGATHYSVSSDGKTYTFFIRHGMRFSNGEPITAASYKRAFERFLNPAVDPNSVVSLADPRGVNIVGASAYAEGKATTVPGLQIRGRYRFVVKLVEPSSLLLSVVALPFLQAVPTRLPMEHVGQVPFPGSKQLPSGGRYYVSSYVPDQTAVLRKNRYYRGSAPGRAASILFDLKPGGIRAKIESVKSGQNDIVFATTSRINSAADLVKDFRSRGRLRTLPSSCVYYFALNTSRPVFQSVRARKAFNFALDRTRLAYMGGRESARPTDQLLTPVIPGYRNADIYPDTPQLTRAKRLARGHTGHVIVWHPREGYTGFAPLAESALKSIGFTYTDTTVAGDYDNALARRGAQFDLAPEGWCADYPDPYNYLNTFYDGRSITDNGNLNLAYFDNARVNKQLEHAAALRPPKRYRVYGQLDSEIMRRYAPYAPFEITKGVVFLSPRLDPRSIHGDIYGVVIWGRVALKGR